MTSCAASCARAAECPEDAARAAAAVLGGSRRLSSRQRAATATPRCRCRWASRSSGPRKWLRSATSIFSTKSNVGTAAADAAARPAARQASKKLDAPGAALASSRSARQDADAHHTHTGHGRRDQLTAGERTRILRMLRDEGGRIADEESQVFIGARARAEVRLRLR